MKSFIYSVLVFASLNCTAQAIPSDVKKIVCFIYTLESNELKPLGTGFFVGVEDTLSRNRNIAIYLVTAKHVLKKDSILLDKIYVRVNKKDSLSDIGIVQIKRTGRNKNVFVHQDSTVDIAVIPVNLDQSILDFLVLTRNFLTTKESFKNLNIKEGSEVFFTGMFTPYLGDKRNYPIVRFGRVALVTDEKIQWDKNEKTNLYLVESTTFGGNSGSPVFFYLGSNRGDGSIRIGPPEMKLAGIMKGYFGGNLPISIIETAKIPVSQVNLGIAAVVPSYFLEEILYGNELRQKRGF